MDEITAVAKPSWGSTAEDMVPVIDARALDGTCQAVLLVSSWPTSPTLKRFKLVFKNMSNAVCDALEAFVKTHILPPVVFTYTDQKTGTVYNCIFDHKARPSIKYEKPNRNSMELVLITV